jgi:pimeloyl-ACP methyl ester carboxylesterase
MMENTSLMQRNIAMQHPTKYLLLRALLAAGLFCGGASSPLAARAQRLSMPVVGTHAPSPRAALVRIMTAPHLQASWFAPTFTINGAPAGPAQLQQGRDSTAAALGRFAGLAAQPAGTFLLLYKTAVVQTQITLDGQGRVAALAFGPPKANAERFDVGGYRLYLHCMGTGSPTVLLEAGLGSTSDVWYQVQPQIARVTRVCAYDRAGLGGSDPGPTPRTSATIVAELHTLLARAHTPSPYVLVGHSIAGYHLRVFAHRYPHTVAGVVLVDASHPDQIARELAALGPGHAGEDAAVAAVRKDLADTRPDPNERFDITASAAQARATGSLAHLPLVVLTRGKPVEPPALPHAVTARLEQTWRSLQNDLASLSSDSVHAIATGSGHFIQLDQPALVITAIRQVVQAVRHHTALPACAATFPPLDATCVRAPRG